MSRTVGATDSAQGPAQGLEDFADALVRSTWLPDDAPAKAGHLIRRNRRATLPTVDELRTLPLHAKTVPLFNEGEFRRRAAPHVLARYDQLFCELSRPCPPTVTQLPRMLVPEEHADLLVKCGSVRYSDTCPENSWPVDYFCVVENKQSSFAAATSQVSLALIPDDVGVTQRLRPIGWAKTYLDQSEYTSDKQYLIMKSHRDYATMATEEACAAFDVACSYYCLPIVGRFHYATQDGRFLIVERMLFGLDSAAELTNIVCAVTAGHCDFVKPQFAAPLCPYVHIDNMAVAGSFAQVSQWSASVRRSAHALNLPLNDEPWNEPVDTMVFAGIRIDCKEHAVSLACKFMVKFRHLLQSTVFHDREGFTLVAQGLEKVMSTLLYASAVQRLPVHRYWKLLKWYRRRLHFLARGQECWDAVLRVPQSCAAELEQWIAAGRSVHSACT
jgi:hypothetical protein